MKVRFNTLTLILALIASAMPQAAFAWGKVGHSAVANIAEARLDAAVLKQVKELLALEHFDHMQGVASWADGARDDYDVVHSTRIPFDGTPLPDELCPNGKICAHDAISRYRNVLADRSQPAAERLTALKFIIHLVGDLHQPLHGSDPIGYNMVLLRGEGPLTIHAVWDNNIITRHGATGPALANELRNNGIVVQTGGTPLQWAMESSSLAGSEVYSLAAIDKCWSYKEPFCSDNPVTLPADYDSAKYPIVAKRIKQAGYRLAELLNAALAE